MSDEAVSNEALRYESADALFPAANEPLWRRFLRAPARGDETLSNVGVAIRAMAIALVVFAAFGSAEMRHAARNLRGNVVSDVMVVAADRWHIMMRNLGPAHLQPAVRRVFDTLRDKRW